MRKRKLEAGDVVSFSAGSAGNQQQNYRLVHSDDNRLSQVLRAFPELAKSLDSVPFIINCYPATLGHFTNAVFCDTYLRGTALSRALTLCAHNASPAILLGQPLSLAQLICEHAFANLPIPKIIFVVVGGYFCPPTLENFIKDILSGAEVHFLHAYGMAEADFAIFVGQRHETEDIAYIHVCERVEYRIIDGFLELKNPENQEWLKTNDFSSSDASCRLSISPANRLDENLREEFDGWSYGDWARRTGYTMRNGSQFTFQLRPFEEEGSTYELAYGKFVDKFGMSFLDKPIWRWPR